MSELPDAAIEAAAEHDHSGPDSACPACQPLAEVIRDRMRWPSMHWGELHPDAYASLARAVHQAGYVQLESAMPAIREHIAQEIDVYADPARDTGSKTDRLQRIGMQSAARIVRGGTP